MSSNQKQLVLSLDLPWTDTHFVLTGLFMIAFGLFVLTQGTIKKKITHITLGYLVAFLLFGHEVFSGSGFGLVLIGIFKVAFLGSAIMYGLIKLDLLGYGIIGGSAGLFASIPLLFEFGGEVKSLPDFMKEAQGFPLLCIIGGPIVCMLSKDRSETLASVIAGVGMIVLGISGIASKKDFYIFLYNYKVPLIFLEIVAGLIGVYAQMYFQKKELQVRQELLRQMEEEKAKNTESTDTDYKKMNNSGGARSSSSGDIAANRAIPQPVRMPMPTAMGYPPVMQQPGYQPVPYPTYYNPYQNPVAYNPGYINYSGSQPKPMPMPGYAGSPPKTNYKPVQQIKTEVSNIHIKSSNKNYDF